MGVARWWFVTQSRQRAGRRKCSAAGSRCKWSVITLGSLPVIGRAMTRDFLVNSATPLFWLRGAVFDRPEQWLSLIHI